MSTSKKRAKVVKAPMKKAGKVASGVVVAKSKPKANAKAAPTPKMAKAALVAKTAVRPAAKKTTPAAKKPAKAVPPKLKLVAAVPATNASVKTVPKVAVPEPVQDKVRIFQIYYRPEQRQYLDPAFEPYNNEGDNSPLLEFNVFRKLAKSELVKGAELWGALSWKFKEKTGLSGEQLRQITVSNPGYDVYYCNPYPDLEGLYHNLWLQGETTHPNFLILCRDFFRAAGLDDRFLVQMLPAKGFAASNYFVATPRFWSGYIEFINEIVQRAELGMSATARSMIYSSAADQKGFHAAASYMPFIIERLFGVYVSTAQKNYKYFKFSSGSKDENLNVHLRLLRQMKDVAVSSRSLWMATCWVNYRNIYMQQAYGASWCGRYLKSITPPEISY